MRVVGPCAQRRAPAPARPGRPTPCRGTRGTRVLARRRGTLTASGFRSCRPRARRRAAAEPPTTAPRASPRPTCATRCGPSCRARRAKATRGSCSAPRDRARGSSTTGCRTWWRATARTTWSRSPSVGELVRVHADHDERLARERLLRPRRAPGSTCMQLMHAYVQKSSTTTLPRRSASDIGRRVDPRIRGRREARARDRAARGRFLGLVIEERGELRRIARRELTGHRFAEVRRRRARDSSVAPPSTERAACRSRRPRAP